MLIKCNIFKYQCGGCGKSFEAPVYLAGYGKFLLKNYKSGDLAWLDAISDNAFKEASRLIKKHPKLVGLQANAQSNIVQDVIGYVYDKSICGGNFGINANPMCPHCGEHNFVGYEEILPSKIVEINVDIVTSNTWSELSEKEKISLVDKLLEGY